MSQQIGTYYSKPTYGTARQIPNTKYANVQLPTWRHSWFTPTEKSRSLHRCRGNGLITVSNLKCQLSRAWRLRVALASNSRAPPLPTNFDRNNIGPKRPITDVAPLATNLLRRLAADRANHLPAAIVIADRTALFGQRRQGAGLLRGHLRFGALVAKWHVVSGPERTFVHGAENDRNEPNVPKCCGAAKVGL